MSLIYKIYCKDENIKDCYIGSTNNFIGRKYKHKSNCNNINSKEYNNKLYTFIRANSGWENFDFMILEQFENKMIKQDLVKIEGQYIKNNNATLNFEIAGRTAEEYYQDNKTKKQEYNKVKYEENKEKRKIYYEENKKQILENSKVKVICEFCKSLIRKYDLKRHQRTKKCIEIQNNIL